MRVRQAQQARRVPSLLACPCVVILAGLFAVVGTGGQEMTSVKAGVYTPEQADRGQLLYRNKCASCHDNTRFTDETLFHNVYAGKPLWELFDAISETMPEDDPGGMQPQEYADIVAYLLRMNRYPTGATELAPSKDALSVILFEKR